MKAMEATGDEAGQTSPGDDIEWMGFINRKDGGERDLGSKIYFKG